MCKIETLRCELMKKISSLDHSDLSAEEILRLSQELDTLIVEEMKSKSKSED